MISRYSRKELVDIWSEENKYKIWLDVEVAAAEAMEKYKIIPKGVASIVKKKGKIKVNFEAFYYLSLYGSDISATFVNPDPDNIPIISRTLP